MTRLALARWIGIPILACSVGVLRAADMPLPILAPVDLAKLKPADFTDDELELPYYLAHFHRLANSIESDGPERGAIRLSVWRGNANVYNARVMESILSLAFWYCLDRPWNPYRGHTALRARLEAALDFWCRVQNADGQFSEYGPNQWNLAATAFATKFGGEALLLLHQRGAPVIDATLLARADEALRKAIHATVTLPQLYTHGKTYTNQYGNVWGGGLAYFAVHDDRALRAQWEKRFHDSRADFQSPAGYYYERDGPDFGYTTSTHDHNSRQAWEWWRGTPLGEELLAKEKLWFEWLAHNAVPEPDGSGWVYNRAIETRQKHTSFRTYDSPLGEFIPLVRAFAESREERGMRRQRERAELEATWPKVRPLPVGDFWAYSPYAFLHRRLNEWLPTTAERDAARKLLPVFAPEIFTRQFADSRKAVAFTYVRRPAYYAAFNAGQQINVQQRYGLGLLWSPALGAVLQSQTASDAAAWGTRAADAKAVYESGSLEVKFMDGQRKLVPTKLGVRDWPGASDFEAHYTLGPRGEKNLRFANDRVEVTVRHAGEFTEILPLLVPSDGKLTVAADRVTLGTPRGIFVIRFGEGVNATTSNGPAAVLNKQIVVLTLRARDKLIYTLGAE